VTSGRTILLTFATHDFRTGQRALATQARAVGFSDVIEASPADLAGTDFARRHESILSLPRGAGYWLWKPYLIARHVEMLGPDDVLIYSDSSNDGFYAWRSFPTALRARAADGRQGFVIGPVLHQHGPLSTWTKRDALILLGADRQEIVDRPTIQASPSVWARAFLSDWLSACGDDRILTDRPNTQGIPNHAGFRAHRHDQSVLSLIAYRDGYDVLDLANTGVFRLMALRPGSEMTNRFLKSPANIEALVRGIPPAYAMVSEQARLTWRRLRARHGRDL